MILYGILYPNLAVVTDSLIRDGSWSIANYREVLSQRFVLEATINSIVLSVATVLLCAIVAVPLAFLFERYSFPGRRVFIVRAAPRKHRQKKMMRIGAILLRSIAAAWMHRSSIVAWVMPHY